MSCAWEMVRAAGGGGGGDGVGETHNVRFVLLLSSSVESMLLTALPSEAPNPAHCFSPDLSPTSTPDHGEWSNQDGHTGIGLDPYCCPPHPVLKSCQFALLCPSNLLTSPCPIATA